MSPPPPSPPPPAPAPTPAPAPSSSSSQASWPRSTWFSIPSPSHKYTGTPIFHGKIYGFPLRFSIKPIQWTLICHISHYFPYHYQPIRISSWVFTIIFRCFPHRHAEVEVAMALPRPSPRTWRRSGGSSPDGTGRDGNHRVMFILGVSINGPIALWLWLT